MSLAEKPDVRDLIADGGRPGRVDKARYLDRARFEAENAQLWPRVWQMACRLSDIPEVGDSYEYTIADESVMVVRSSASTVRAFHNTCPHRGQLLRAGCGSGPKIQCPFHAWTWDLEGRLVDVPSDWDFPGVTTDSHGLRTVRAETWAGFVFVNLDPEAEPLEDFLETIPAAHAHLPLEELVRAFWIEIRVGANWKLVVDAFSEAYHIVGQHPQMLFYFDDVNTRYSIIGERGHAHHASTIGDASPHLNGTVDAEGSFAAMVEAGALDFIREGYATLSNRSGDAAPPDPADLRIPEGMSAREYVLQLRRASLEAQGVDLSGLRDEDIVDADQFHIFPNAFVTASISGAQVMRMRPHGDDHEAALFEFVLLARPSEHLPSDVPKQSFDDETSAIDHLRQTYGDSFALAFEQDVMALPTLHRSMKSSSFRQLTLARTQEAIIANRHRTIDRFLGRAAPA